MVIIYHFGANHFFRPFHFLFNGELGVNIFFVISGFLITTLLLKEKLQYGKVSFKRFYTRRALRIVPVAYLFLLFITVLNITYKLGLSTSNFTASFLFYKNFPYQIEPYTGHFWSLAAEMQFYLIFPYLLVTNIKRYVVLMLFLLIAIPTVSIAGYYHLPILYTNPIIYQITKAVMYSFWNGPFVILIGSLLAVLLFNGTIKVDKGRGGDFLSFLLFVIILTINNKLSIFYIKYISEFLSAILIAWIILLNLRKINLLSVILESQVFVKVGTLSYSIYIWQQLFIGDRSFPPWAKPFHDCPLGIFIILKFVSIFVIASISYYFFELKFLKMKSRYE